MKVTVEMFGGRYEVTGLRKAEAEREPEIDNGKETYEIVYLRAFRGKSYKTIQNALKAISKFDGMEYVPADTINMFGGWD